MIAVQTSPRWPDGKPRIYRHNGTWFCRLRQDLGHGETPAAAFYSCLRESMLRYNFA